jgi:regulation of enolase protein 1 (concanavalin A-like superfamily)
MVDRCQWLNEPVRWDLGPDGLAVVTDQATDFWRLGYRPIERVNIVQLAVGDMDEALNVAA